jgi:acyl-CoA dehydrogenase
VPYPFSEEQQELRETLREFGRREVRPGAAARDRDGTYPQELVERLAGLGLLGISVPEAFGGGGLPMATQVAAIEEVGYADASLGSIVVGHYLGMEGFGLYGSEEQKRRWLVPLAGGEYRAAFALTEPEAGSDIGSMRTTAVRAGDAWVVNGTKTFISSAREAGLTILFAKTDPTAGFRGISAFALPAGTSGVSYSEPEEKLGIRGEHAYQVTLADVGLPADHLIGAEGRGGAIALDVLNRSRIDAAALANGVALRALDLAVGYASERRQFGRALREFQMIQASLAEMDVRIELARIATYRAADVRDAAGDLRRAASIAKYAAAEACFWCVDRALQIHGGYGIIKDFEIERLYRDCRVFRIYEGTSEIQLLGLADLLARRHDAAGDARR